MPVLLRAVPECLRNLSESRTYLREISRYPEKKLLTLWTSPVERDVSSLKNAGVVEGAVQMSG